MTQMCLYKWPDIEDMIFIHARILIKGVIDSVLCLILMAVFKGCFLTRNKKKLKVDITVKCPVWPWILKMLT